MPEVITETETRQVLALMSRLEVVYTIHCQRCEDETAITNAESEWGAAAQIYAKGWRTKNISLCPECAKK